MPWKNINYDALLFDLDGTLIDSMPLHNQAWIEVLSEKGLVMTNDILNEYMGIPNMQTVEIFNKRFGWNLDPGQITTLKENSFLEKLKHVKVIEVTVQAAKENFGKVPMAIVTGSAKKPALELIKMLDIEKYFPLMITSEDTLKHKPDPEPFLLAAKKLNVDPKKCLVFEDGAMGIQAANAAGMKVIKVVLDAAGPLFQLQPL